MEEGHHLGSGAGQGLLHRRKRVRDEDDDALPIDKGGKEDKRQATAERSVSELPQQRRKRHHEAGADLQQGLKGGGAELSRHVTAEGSRRRSKRAKSEPEADVREEEEGDDDSEDTMELALDADCYDERRVAPEEGGGNDEGCYFGYQLELCGEAVKGRRKQVVIQKRWRPDKTFVIGREQCIATTGGLGRVGQNIERISREHFQIRCSTAAAKRGPHEGCSPKPCFFLTDLSGARALILMLPRCVTCSPKSSLVLVRTANGTHLNNVLLGKGVERELRHRYTCSIKKPQNNAATWQTPLWPLEGDLRLFICGALS
jgi:hypothetical protein